MSRRLDYSCKEPYPRTSLPVAYDFSNIAIINHPKNSDLPEIVVFHKGTTRQQRTVIQTGSFVSEHSLKKILKRDGKDRAYYQMIEALQKNDKLKKALFEDFDVLRDFFPADLVLEVMDHCIRFIPKLQKETGFTPRKRRTYIIAVFRSVCRRNGRKITQALLNEINNRFEYKRTIKYLEVCKAESELINWKLLPQRNNLLKEDLPVFYLNIINNINRLKKDPDISSNKNYLEIISLTQKIITDFAKDHKEALHTLIKHHDKDFVSRMCIWTIAKYLANEKFNLDFKRVNELPGWRTLFLIDRIDDIDTHQIPIRSFKYIFWHEFEFRKQLKELQMFPNLEV